MAFEFQAEPRAELGKQNCKKLRDQGRLPGVLYGGSLKEPRNITIEMKGPQRTMKENGRSAEYVVVLEGKSYPVRIGEVRREPIRKGFLHVDFIVTEGKAG